MALLIDTDHLPAMLTVGPMTDEEFAEMCGEHSDLSFELTADGELIIMPPNYSITGARNQRIGAQLLNWADLDGRGVACDSSTGYTLPSGARRSPDASWVLNDRVDRLPDDNQERFWKLCPDFVIELRSHSDRLKVLREKMAEWIDNGAKLAWLIDPDNKTVEIYRPGSAPETRTNPDKVIGEGPVAGFVLRLEPVWNPRRRRQA
jgi:Uma2 family endonuclease